MQQAEILIIGAGMAGLTAAFYLTQQGKHVKILERTDRPGGRVASDQVDGFILDRGFQIFLKDYPEARKILDYDTLNFRAFGSGADIYTGTNWKKLRDPREGVVAVLGSLTNSPASIADLFKLLGLKKELKNIEYPSIYNRKEQPTLDYWKSKGFSERMIDSFLKPFYKGIFLDSKLTTSSRLFEFTFKMFAEGDAVIPQDGMSAIPRHLANLLPVDTIQYEQEVIKLENNAAHLRTGACISAEHIIMAFPEPIQGITGTQISWKQNTTFYFSADDSIPSGKFITLDSRENSSVNSIVNLSAVQSSYSPEGKHLMCVSCLNTPTESQLRTDLSSIYGPDVEKWTLIRSYHIPQALPDLPIKYAQNVQIRKGLYRCGDHTVEGSINGAMRSGRLVAEHILNGS